MTLIPIFLILIPCALGAWLWWSMRGLDKPRSGYKSRKPGRPPRTFGRTQDETTHPDYADKDTPPNRHAQGTTLVDRVERPPRDFSHAMKAQHAADRHAATTFAAIDFETANSRYYSACSLGVVMFEGGEPIDRKCYMINPGCRFDDMNVSIHGITPAQVADAPKFDALWPELLPIFRKYRIVAYSDFDAKVIRSLIRHYGLTADGPLALDYFDVCQYARDNILGLANYKLPTVAEFLQIDGLKHHNAVSDAETCGKIYVRLYAERGRKIRASLDIPATYAQQDYIRNLGGHVPPTLSKRDASRLIESLIERNQMERETARIEAKKIRRRSKEEEELRFVAAAIKEPGYAMKKSSSKRLQAIRELQHLIARIVADDIIEVSEAREIAAWLETHKVLDSNFKETIEKLCSVSEDKSMNESEMRDIYNGLLDCLVELRDRPAL